jgi:hypothetical protein
VRLPSITAVAPVALSIATACHDSSSSGLAPSPSAAVSTAPTDSSTNESVLFERADSTPCVSAIAEHQRSVMAHLDAARAKTSARDGAGCLAELDAYDREAWDPNPSTSPSSSMAMSRAMCMMLAGDCAHGKVLYRAAMASNASATLGPEMLDRTVDSVAALYCQGPGLDPRDALLKALMDLNQGAYMSTTSVALCQGAIDTVERLLPVVKPRNAEDSQVTQAPAVLRIAGPECLARAGDCAAAWRVFHNAWLADKPYDEVTLRSMFASTVRRCADP